VRGAAFKSRDREGRVGGGLGTNLLEGGRTTPKEEEKLRA